jgi:branched-chain amino acid aminotransferase
MNVICYNGKLIDAELPAIRISNRAFRYGDGIFETMKVKEGIILLKHFHFERLFRSLSVLQINANDLQPADLEKDILFLCEKNNLTALARVRLEVFRDYSGCGYVIEAGPLDDDPSKLNDEGLAICIHPFVRKACDAYSNLKSANFLPYVMAEIFREEKSAGECLVLNTYGHIADGSRTNVFLVKDNEVLTPALHQGCVDGVMRRFVIDALKKSGYEMKQAEVTVDMLHEADGIFLTNSIRGIKWVGELDKTSYSKKPVAEIYAAVTGLQH